MITISHTNFTSNLSLSYFVYLQMAEKGVKAPSPKELRMMAAFQRYMDGE